MVTAIKAPPREPVAGDVAYAMLDELRAGWDVAIDDKAITLTSRDTGHVFGYFIQNDRLDHAISRAYGGGPPDFR